MGTGDQVRVDPVVRASEPDRAVASVKLGLLLLDDVGLDRDPEVVGLPGQVCRSVVVLPSRVEGGLAQIAPQHGHHAQLMRHLERLRRLLQLAHPPVRSEVDRCPHRNRPQLPRLLHAREHDLVVAVGVGQQLVVVQLDQKRDPVRVPARHRPQHAQRGRDRVATALQRQLDDVARIEVHRIRRERGPRRVLDPLVDRQDGHVAGAGEPPVPQDLLHASQHLGVAIRTRDDPVHEVGAGEVEFVT